MIFFTANQTWKQPPAWAHEMIHTTWQPQQLQLTAPPSVVAVAAASSNGSVITLRIVNNGTTPLTMRVVFEDGHRFDIVTERTLAAPSGDLSATNPWWQPDLITPSVTTHPWTLNSLLELPAASFTTATFHDGEMSIVSE